MNNGILVIIVTYFPNKDLLLKNIGAFIDHIDKVLIWENTPDSKKHIYRYISHEKVEYCGDGINSISHALNYAWSYAIDNSYKYLLTMDQDSIWNNFPLFLKETIFNSEAPEGIYGPVVNDEKYEEKFHPKILITSGMLVPVKILTETNGYNEDFIIDGVDSWFCYTAMEKGYNSFCIKGCYLLQNFGNFHGVSFLGYTFKTLDYPPRRLYEIYKSYIALSRRFKLTNEYKKQFLLYLMFKWPIKIILVENNKIKKIESIIKGIMAGVSYNMKKHV